uniref:RRM domain-containing protein n=1 Tax=Meloidogyne floridensis TaxID=298350 RepID=A0A915NXS5_9BILA
MQQQDIQSEYETKHPFVINTLTDSHDSIRERKEGEIVYDERRKKWYRVKKTMYPTHVTVGPHNLGDPDDTFLRKYESNVLIPDILAKRIEKNECRETFMKFAECMRDGGAFTGTHNCRPFYKKFQDCKEIKEERLLQIFDQFGEVDRVLIDKSGKNAYAIIEFEEEEAAKNLLGAMQRIKIGKSMVRIRPRRVDFNNSTIKQKSISITNSENVLKFLEDCPFEFSTQFDTLIEKFALSNDLINERQTFALKLQSHFQRYFSSPLSIRLFGSSSTGLGFIDSDLDLNFILDNVEINKNGCSSPSTSTTSNDMEIDIGEFTPEELLKSPLDAKPFLNLTKTNQIRILNTLINSLRKESSIIISHVPVKDARTPILFLTICLNQVKIPCEISVQNLFGEFKANLIGDLVKAETSGILFRLLFFLKLWASSNELFSSDNDSDGPKSCWNSYTLSLCTIGFLQKINRIPPIFKFLDPNSRKINGWAIEYSIPKFTIEKEELPLLLKDLFTFLFLNLKSDLVLLLQEGKIIKVNDFKKEFLDKSPEIEKRWRFSLVNIQDPLELSHNVAANVGKASLSKMRWKLTYAISVLKHSKYPNCMQKLFQLQNLKDLRNEKTKKFQIKRSKMESKEQMNGNEDKEMLEMDVDMEDN